VFATPKVNSQGHKRAEALCRAGASLSVRVAGISRESVVDGPGLRTVLFTQGCPRSCPGCHNPDTQPLDGGVIRDVGTLFQELIADVEFVKGITFSGGEPFIQAEPLAELARLLRQRGLDIIIYTGYLFEDLLKMSRTDQKIYSLLAAGDILVDGPYIEAESDLNLAFRGSRNQRLIDLPSSLQMGKAMEYEV
jgi:anaerobic ribonucleoside-triphosphate reductase activating protein